MTQKTLYTARVRTDGDRSGGVSRSDDGRLDLAHTPPGTSGKGTNPEQLLAAGWSACFQGAMGIAAKEMKVSLPQGTSIDAEIDLCHGDAGWSLQARLNVSVPERRPRSRAHHREGGARDLPILQSYARQHPRHDQRRLNPGAAKTRRPSGRFSGAPE